MELFSKMKGKFGNFSKILAIAIFAVFVVIIAIAVFMVKSREQPEVVTYNYNAVEQQIADEVKSYLSLYLTLPDETAAQIADAAVQNYNIIIASDVDIVNDDHTDAIKQRIRLAMVSLLDEETAAALTDDDLDALSSGIASIIWNSILSQIKATTIENDYKEEYLYLSESIQNQINELEERKMKVSIQANIKQNITPADVDAESLLTTINSMSDKEIQELASSLGISAEELRELVTENNKDLSKELEEKIIDEIKKEISKEVQYEVLTKYGNAATSTTNAKNGENGKDGKDGQNGKDGKDGENGKDGEDGQDGKDAYEIAVDSGFLGTREEWLESIQGKDGAFSGYNIMSNQNNVYLYKDKEAE